MRYRPDVLVVAVVLAAAVTSPSVCGATQSKFLELIITAEQGHLTLVQEAIRSGQLPGPRQQLFREGFWLVQADDVSGQTLYTITIPDPRALSVRTQTTLSARPPAILLARLPYDRRLSRVRLFRLMRSVDPVRRVPNPLEPQSLVPPMDLPAEALELVGGLTLTVP